MIDEAGKTLDGSGKSRSMLPLAVGLIVLIAALLRFGHVQIAEVQEPIRGDAIQYVSYAWNLVHHGVFSAAEPGEAVPPADGFRDPGYPTFLGAIMVVSDSTESWYRSVLLLQALLGTLTVAGVIHLGLRLLPSWAALAAGMLAAIWPHHVTASGYLLTETLFGFLLVAALCLLIEAARRKALAWWILAGLAFGLAASVNAVATPFALGLGAMLLWRRLVDWRAAAALVLAALLMPTLWQIRSMGLEGTLRSSDRATMNLVQGSWPEYRLAWQAARIRNEPEGYRVLEQVHREIDLLRDDPPAGWRSIRERIGSDPATHARWYLYQKPLLFWGWGVEIGDGDIFIFPTKNAPFADQPALNGLRVALKRINPVISGATVVLLLVAGAMLWRRESASNLGRAESTRQVGFSAVTLTLLMGMLVYWVLQAEPRYAIPFRPLQMLFLLLMAAHFWSWLAARKQT
jgi:4-amino-4-deoxy-L-arabinose transferase-like glycosyltransferase